MTAALPLEVAGKPVEVWFGDEARVGQQGTLTFADATCGAIRLRLLTIGALVKISVRRITVAMASACPWRHEFALAHAMLRQACA
jgi:Transposase DDE domain group 1